MPVKKNTTLSYTTNTQQRGIFVDPWKIAALVGTSIVSSLVVGAFSAYNVLNSDHFKLMAIDDKINSNFQDLKQIKSEMVNKELFQLHIKQNEDMYSMLKELVDSKSVSIH